MRNDNVSPLQRAGESAVQRMTREDVEAENEAVEAVLRLRPENLSGINPTEYKVLIRPNLAEEKSKGGIILPDESKERNQFAQMEGVLIDISPLAFTYATPMEWRDAPRPKPGDRVLFAKYAGALVKGKDGIDYRLVNDKDIAAVLS